MQQHKYYLICKTFISTLMWCALATRPIGMTNGAKILSIFPHATESHFTAMRTFMMELAKREHSVTLFSSHRLDDHVENLVENIIEPEFQFWSEVQKLAGVNDLESLSRLNSYKLNENLAGAGHSLVDYFLTHEKMQELLKTPPEAFDYDLIIVDLFYTEALLALGHYFSVPVIGVVNTDFANYMLQVQDIMVPAACLPYDLENYVQSLSYWQRLANIQACVERRQSFISAHYSQQEKLIEKHFRPLKASIPPVMDLQTNLDLLMVNNYYPVAAVKPLIPNIILVGGLHIRAAKEIPWHVRRFLDEAPFGAIYMHLGDEKNCNDIPKDKLDTLFHALGKRQERVIWTCHDAIKVDNLPKNIMIQHLVPQTDIVAHPHVKLFVTNGDIMALQESIFRHVPLLGIPLFENEFKNIKLAEKLQIGVRVDYNNLTEIALNQALDTLMQQEFYALNVRDISKVYRDRPLGGLTNAIFWLDYIHRYGSGPLKTHRLAIPLNQLHLSDLRVYNYLVSFLILCTLIGLYYLSLFFWTKRQTEKLFSKLN